MAIQEETMSTAGPVKWVELAKRAANGLEVVLLWDRSSNRVKVAVNDGQLCHHLDFEVARAEALSSFSHPFAYATSLLADGAPGAAFVSAPTPKGEQR
jgi:hypothetical protein